MESDFGDADLCSITCPTKKCKSVSHHRGLLEGDGYYFVGAFFQMSDYGCFHNLVFSLGEHRGWLCVLSGCSF